MRHSFLFKLVILLVAVSSQAAFLTSTPVGPGIIHHHEYKDAGPWNIHILEIDLRDTMNTLQTVKANNRISGYEGTSSMAARKDYEGHRIVGAINADFYASGGISIGAQIINGHLLKRPYPRSVFGFSDNKSPMIDILSYNGQVMTQDGASFAVSGINEDRLEDQMVLYNHYIGATTGTNEWGTEITLEYLEPSGINKAVRALVTLKDSLMLSTSGDMAIPAMAGAVISGHGLARDFLDTNVFVGDTLLIQLNLPPSTDILSELVGGGPRLIRNGIKSVEWEQESMGSSFSYDRHPRTAVGFSADSSRVYFVTVDGRQAGFSVGMSLFELADYMLSWGMYQGINLDGGGSTTMVVRGSVANRPSDAGGERTVANALMAVSLAPQGPLTYLRLPWEETYTMVESQLQFSVKGSDFHYNPVSLSGTNLSWFCDTNIGSISSTGLFTASASVEDGYVWVSTGGIIDSVLVHVTDIATLSLLPNPVVLKLGETQIMTAEARDNFDNVLQVEPEAYTWTVPSEIATITPTGVVSAEHVGTGTIQASFHGVSGSVPLSVGTNSTVIIDDFSTTGNFTLSGLRVDLGACSLTPSTDQFVSTPSSGKLAYSLTTGGTTVLYMNCNLPISGTPESISISVYGDNSAHWLRGEFKTPTGDYMLVDFNAASPGINWDDSWKELMVPLSEATPKYGYPNAVLTFPITWTKIYLAETDDNKKDSGVIYLDDFKVTFITTDVESDPRLSPESFNLESNFPNPFNASTRFRFNIDQAGLLELKLFSVDGREVNTLEQRVAPGQTSLIWSPPDLSSGVYIYQATLNHSVIGGKCLLLK